MARRLFSTKPLSKAMMTYYQMDRQLQWNLNQNTKLFIQYNAYENVVMQIVGRFVRDSVC